MSVTAHQERLMNVIRGPHVSEKSHMAAESNQVVFKVSTDATKAEIRQAVELLFEVEVENVMVHYELFDTREAPIWNGTDVQP